MKSTIIAVLAIAALPVTAALATNIPQGCNPAKQNWVNGSGYTCPLFGGSAVAAPEVPTTAATPTEPIVIGPVFPTTNLTPLPQDVF